MAKNRFRTCNIENESQHKRSNGPSQPSLAKNSSQLNSLNENSQPNRSNGSSHSSWSHPSHVPSQVPYPQPQESKVNPQFEDNLDEEWLREEEMQSELTKRNMWRITRLVDVWNLAPEECIILTFNKDSQVVSKEGGTFSRFIGTIARKPHLCPIKYKNWHDVPDPYKEICWNIIKGQKDNIALDRAKLYVSLHKRKDGTQINEEAATKIKKLEDLMRSQTSSSEGNVSGRISWSPNDIYSQVVGKGKEHHGRVQGLGFGPTPSKHGFMSNSCDHLRMASDEERMRDKDIITKLKEQLITQGDQLQTQGVQLQAQDTVINALKEQVAFLMRQRHSSGGLQATDGSSGIPDQAFPQTHQRSSFGSHEI